MESATVPAELLGIIAPDPGELVRLRLGARDLRLVPRRRSPAAMAGGYRSLFRGRGMEFEEVRPYQPGDDIRTIDWRVTARSNNTYTKVFREEKECPVLVVTDLRNNMFFGSSALKSVVAARIAATLAWAALGAGDRVGGLVFAPGGQRDIRARRSHHTVLQLIQTLTESCAALRAAEDDSHSLAEILEDSRRVARPGTTVFVISDFQDLDRETEKPLFQLARHCNLGLCHLHDPLERELPPPGHYGVTNGHRRTVLDTSDIDLRRRFEARFRQRQDRLRRLAGGLRAQLLEFTTAAPVLPVLRASYGKNRRRRS